MNCRLLLLLCLCCTTSYSEIKFFPASHHRQFQTFGFFSDETLGFLFSESGRGWGSLGGSFTVSEISIGNLSTQAVFYGSVNTAQRQKGGALDYATESFDARFGFALETVLDPRIRLSLAGLHFSGHTSDGILDADLQAPNLGIDQIVIRLIYDPFPIVRIGGSLKPIVGSDPVTAFLAADQFMEVFPLGVADDPTHPTPYFSFSVDEGGANYSQPTLHLQVGAYFGGHLQHEELANLRLALGYYHGSDPRLKYAAFKNSKMHFFYFGILLNL